MMVQAISPSIIIYGANIPVSPTVNTTYSLVSVTDANLCAGSGNSGTPLLTVNPVPTVNAVANQS
ncbi:MAG: hypothetical protein IPP73_00990 [Chitinophagaceae bacterium]|nr:hypothetical protein [Chitinophagaceae bacterium]